MCIRCDMDEIHDREHRYKLKYTYQILGDFLDAIDVLKMYVDDRTGIGITIGILEKLEEIRCASYAT